MKLEDFLVLDIRVEGNKELLQRALSKTKWLEKFSPKEIEIEVLETLYKKVVKKYDGGIAYVQNAGDDSWSFMIRNHKTNAWINTIYAYTLFEGMAKTVLVLYGYYIRGMKFKDAEEK